MLKYFVIEAQSPDVSRFAGDDPALMALLNYPQYITGKVVRSQTGLPEMSVRELELCDGQEGRDWYNEGWVAVGNWVYNVTSKFNS